MSRDPNDVVKVYSGPLVMVEEYQQALSEAGIDSRVVGTSLTASIGSALPDSIELWVHQGDLEKAIATIRMFEEDSLEDREKHTHPTSDPRPGAAPARKEPYTNPDFGG